MKLIDGMLAVTEPSVKVLFAERYYTGDDDWEYAGYRILSNTNMMLFIEDIVPLLKPVEGERCYGIMNGGGEIMTWVYGRASDRIFDTYVDNIVACNPLTLELEKQGLLREVVELIQGVTDES